MTAAAKPHHASALPDDERAWPDPVNAMLDLFEAQVRALVDCGAGPQLRARLKRLLPVEKPEPDLFAASRAAPLTADDEIKLVAGIRACNGFAKLKADALAHSGVALVKSHLEAMLSVSKKARGAA